MSHFSPSYTNTVDFPAAAVESFLSFFFNKIHKSFILRFSSFVTYESENFNNSNSVYTDYCDRIP